MKTNMRIKLATSDQILNANKTSIKYKNCNFTSEFANVLYQHFFQSHTDRGGYLTQKNSPIRHTFYVIEGYSFDVHGMVHMKVGLIALQKI